MYSKDIQKICRFCVFSSPVIGIATHMECKSQGGFYPIAHTCKYFKYDIRKRIVRRKKDVSTLGFTAEDFSIL